MVEGDANAPHVQAAIRLAEPGNHRTSWLTWVEVAGKWCKPGSEEMYDIYRHLLAPMGLYTITKEIIHRAAELVGNYNLKPADAIHAATAIVEGCTEFVTNDAHFRRVTELNVLLLSDFLST